MSKILREIRNFFTVLWDKDADILEVTSGWAGIGWIILSSQHDINVILTRNAGIFKYIFELGIFLWGASQIIALYKGVHKIRRSAAFVGILFWTFLGFIAWNHQMYSTMSSVWQGHPGACGVYISLAFGNALVYFKLGQS